MAKFTKEQIQEKLLNRKKRLIKLEVSLPDLEEIDDQLALVELSAKDVEFAQNASKGPDGQTNEVSTLAGMVSRALVMYETKERIFTDNHIDAIAEWGLLVLQPLGNAIRESSGLTQEQARKN
jgi:hypothetical protein